MVQVSINIHSFGLGEEVTETSKEVLGGKGAGLVWMTQNGYPVPPGFVIGADTWAQWQKNPKEVMAALEIAMVPYLNKLKVHFGYHPLLSVRSGARVSMPGMMDTLLNVGLDGESEPFWADKLGNTAFEDSRNRLHEMYHKLIGGASIPTAMGQLLAAIQAVFESWNSHRAVTYREMHGYDHNWGTAVTVQAMVFGNLNENSCTGVLFTRNPDTGEASLTGEFIVNAQGEDIVAGTHTPKPLTEMTAWNEEVAARLVKMACVMETQKKEVQDIEFTVQDGELYFLQCRNAKRTAKAALRIALEMVKEGLLTEAEGMGRIYARDLDAAVAVSIDPTFTDTPHVIGIAASQGLVSGKPVFSSKEAVACKEPCILITKETTPDDIAGMNAAVGIITMKGGLTSHAAVVARGMNKPAIVGVGLSPLTKLYKALKKAPLVSMDGATGRIWLGLLPTVAGEAIESVAAAQALAFKVSGAVPIITEVPKAYMSEALYALDPKALFSPQIRQDETEKIKTIHERVGTLYLDAEGLLNENMAYYGAFLTNAKLLSMEKNRLNGLANTLTNYKHKVFFITDVPSIKEIYALSNQRIIMRNMGAEELITSPAIVLGGKQSPAIEKVFHWRLKDGDLEVFSVGEQRPAATKTFLSFEQALQSTHV